MVLLCVTTVAAVVLALVYHLGVAATLVTILVGLPALYLAWGPYWDAHRGAGAGAAVSLAEIADGLAGSVGSSWEGEAARRRLNEPFPLPVSWAAADPTLTDPWYLLVKLARTGHGWSSGLHGNWAAGPDDLVGSSDKDGDVDQEGGKKKGLVDVLGLVPTGRLVVLGEPGAGKTMLMVGLVLDLLRLRKTRKNSGPVPVLAGLVSWNPARQDLRSWLEDQLIMAHPALADPPPTGRKEPTQAAALLKAGLILPILDGLDEIPEEVRGPVITLINEALPPGRQFVVTCRSKEYRDVVRSGAMLRAAAAIQLCPLKPGDVGTYLRDDARPAEGRWGFLKDLSAESPVRGALATPLMVGLARAIYNPRPGEGSGDLRDPAEELCSSELANQVAVEDHLLDSFVPSVYAPHADSQRPRWPPGQAQRWLAFLADYLGRSGTADLAWWRLTRAVRAWRPLGTAVRSVLLFGVAWWLAAWLLHLHPEWRHGLELRALLAGGPLGRHVIPLVSYIQGLIPEHVSHDVRSAAAAIVGFFPWRSLASLEVWVALLGAGVGLLSAVFDSRVHPSELATMKIRSLHAPSSYIRALASLMLALVGILLLPLLLLLVPGLTVWHNGHLILGTLVHMRSVWVVLLLVILWMIPGEFSFTEPVKLSASVGPADVLRLDQQASLLAVLPGRAFRTLVVWLCFGPLIALACGIYIACFFLCKRYLGRGHRASDRFADARIWLALGRRMPWRIMKFLDDAHERQVLRQSGTVYQFRHLRLQDRLGEHYPRLSRRLAAAPCDIRGYKGPVWAPVAVCGIGGHKGPLWSLARNWSPNSTAPWSQPFWAVRFQEFASRTLRKTATKVEQAGQVRNEGPGCVQAYRTVGSEGAVLSWVIWALPGREPVLVAGPVWQAWRAAGAQALRDAGHEESDNALSRVGFPVKGASRYHWGRSERRTMRLLRPSAPGVIDVDATRVELRDGSWGDGLLVRDDVHGDWHWEPVNPFTPSPPSAESFKAWRHGSRLEVEAELWYSTPCRAAVIPGDHETFASELAHSELSRTVAKLFVQRGLKAPEIVWEPGVGNTRHRDFTWVIAGPSKNPESLVRVSLDLARFRRSTLVTARAALLVEDVAPWRDLFRPPTGHVVDGMLPFSRGEVAAFLTEAWYTVSELLPTLIVQDLFSMRPEHPPYINLRLIASSRHDEKLKRRDLRKLVEFSPFTSESRQLTWMTVQITSPLQVSPDDRKARTQEALACMAQKAGFHTSHEDWQPN